MTVTGRGIAMFTHHIRRTTCSNITSNVSLTVRVVTDQINGFVGNCCVTSSDKRQKALDVVILKSSHYFITILPIGEMGYEMSKQNEKNS